MIKQSKSAEKWGVLEDGTNQGVKHFVDYWEKYPERIPSLEQRLGVNIGYEVEMLIDNDGELKKYLKLRDNALKYTYNDMNLKLENDNQVYIAVADIPVESKILGFHSQTLVLIYGLNTHTYCSNGQVMTKLEKL